MKSKNLVILIVLAAVLVAAARLTSGNRRAGAAPASGEPLFPRLDLTAVRAVEIASEGKTLRIEQRDDGWAVTNAFGYPADLSRLRPALLALSELKAGHRQPGGASIDPATATEVSLFGENGATLASIVLGATRESNRQQETPYGMFGVGADGRYVSRGGSKEVYLVKESLTEFEPSAKTWLDTELLSVPASSLARIEIAPPDGPAAAFDRSSGALRMEGLAEGETFDDAKACPLESAIAYLRFSDVADPALDDAATELGPEAAHRFSATTRDGVTYTALVGATAPNGSDRYLRLAIDPGTNAVPEELAAKRDRFAWFDFLVSSYAAQNLSHERADFLKPAEDPAEAAPEAAGAPEPPAPPEATAPTSPTNQPSPQLTN